MNIMDSTVSASFARSQILLQNTPLESEKNIDFNNGQDLRDLKSDIEGLNRVASSFESIFIKQILSGMKKTIDEDGGIFPPSPGRKIFQDLMDQSMAEEMGKRGAFGISKLIVSKYQNNVSRGGEA